MLLRPLISKCRSSRNHRRNHSLSSRPPYPRLENCKTCPCSRMRARRNRGIRIGRIMTTMTMEAAGVAAMTFLRMTEEEMEGGS